MRKLLRVLLAGIALSAMLVFRPSVASAQSCPQYWQCRSWYTTVWPGTFEGAFYNYAYGMCQGTVVYGGQCTMPNVWEMASQMADLNCADKCDNVSTFVFFGPAYCSLQCSTEFPNWPNCLESCCLSTPELCS
jgi:hypothetical protein